MPNGDPMITPRGVQLPTVQPENNTTITQKEKKPNMFKQILGGIAGTAVNLVAPGVGTLIGNAIGGGSGSAFGSTASLYEQQQQFEKMQKYNQLANMMQQQQNMAMTQQQQKHSYNMIELQNRVSMHSQEFSTVSNLLKSRHDSQMTAVNNIKS